MNNSPDRIDILEREIECLRSGMARMWRILNGFEDIDGNNPFESTHPHKKTKKERIMLRDIPSEIMPMKTYDALANASYVYLDELEDMVFGKLMKIPGIGKMSAQHIQKAVEHYKKE